MVPVGYRNGNRGVLWHMATGHTVGGKKELPQVPTTEAELFCSRKK